MLADKMNSRQEDKKSSAAIIEGCEFQNHLKIRVFLTWGWILLTLAALVKGFVI